MDHHGLSKIGKKIDESEPRKQARRHSRAGRHKEVIFSGERRLRLPTCACALSSGMKGPQVWFQVVVFITGVTKGLHILMILTLIGYVCYSIYYFF